MLIKNLKKTIGNNNVLTGSELNEKYNHIWEMDEGLQAKAYCLPRNTDEVANICRICYEQNQKVIVFGGLTNLVGATETDGDEVVISMEKLNKIEEIDVQSRSMTVQSGVILERVQNFATENDLMFPLNFGAKGSAQMGGIISQNAGGLRVLRYGMTRNLILGLEAVLIDGTVISSMKKIIKDNSAYDLKQLFIGSEGTLGIVTRAVLRLQEKPKSRNSAIIATDEFDKLIDFLKFIDQGLAGSLSGFEFLHHLYYKAQTNGDLKPPIPYGYKYYVLIESMGAHQSKDHEIMEKLLAEAFNNEMILNAAMAHSESDLKWFWQIREDVKISVSVLSFEQHFDVSAPISAFGNYVDQVVDELSGHDEIDIVLPFGHIADGNIHFIVGKKHDGDELRKYINNVIYTPLKNLGGSVSAEHGIGLHKKDYLKLCRTTEEIELMKLLKKTLDPKLLLNLGKVLDID